MEYINNKGPPPNTVNISQKTNFVLKQYYSLFIKLLFYLILAERYLSIQQTTIIYRKQTIKNCFVNTPEA